MKQVIMTEGLKAAWIAALRSGKYEQGNGWLNAGNKFCCIGVLAEAAIAHHPELQQCKGLTANGAAYFGHSAVLSCEVGLTRQQSSKLMELNDVAKLSFSEIADWIEKNIPVKENPA